MRRHQEFATAPGVAGHTAPTTAGATPSAAAGRGVDHDRCDDTGSHQMRGVDGHWRDRAQAATRCAASTATGATAPGVAGHTALTTAGATPPEAPRHGIDHHQYDNTGSHQARGTDRRWCDRAQAATRCAASTATGATAPGVAGHTAPTTAGATPPEAPRHGIDHHQYDNTGSHQMRGVDGHWRDGPAATRHGIDHHQRDKHRQPPGTRHRPPLVRPRTGGR
ncbi:hypothetical protein ACWGI9_36275 [Streptomyces sp. NPDC054833]